MKKKTAHILLLFLALTVFCTGSGITVIKHCCDRCEMSYSILGQKHACEAHQREEAGVSHNCGKCCGDAAAPGCDMTLSGTDGCSVDRISVDLDSHQAKPSVNVPFVWLSDAFIFISDHRQCDESILHADKEDPPILSDRIEQSFIQVFII